MNGNVWTDCLLEEVETGADLVDAQMDGTDDIVAEFETKGLEKLDASTSAADEAAAEESRRAE